MHTKTVVIFHQSEAKVEYIKTPLIMSTTQLKLVILTDMTLTLTVTVAFNLTTHPNLLLSSNCLPYMNQLIAQEMTPP